MPVSSKYWLICYDDKQDQEEEGVVWRDTSNVCGRVRPSKDANAELVAYDVILPRSVDFLPASQILCSSGDVLVA